MPRFFNTTGPCDPADHYTLPVEPRLPEVRELIERKQYFVLHAPRQSGKTTCFQTLARTLTAEGHYAAIHASCERGQAAGSDVERGVQGVLRAIEERSAALPEDLRPPALDDFLGVEVENRTHPWLTRWCERSARPVVLFLERIEVLSEVAKRAFLAHLREGFGDRPDRFVSSVAFIGGRTFRYCRPPAGPDGQYFERFVPFNVISEMLTLTNFTAEDVAALYGQHTEETGQRFSDEALHRAWELTRGQPWLVNTLARQLVEKIVPDATQPVETEHVDRAAEVLIACRDTNLDSLIERLREGRVQRVIAPILSGELLLGDHLDDDVDYVKDLGLLDSSSGFPRIANPIYHEVIPRALAGMTQETIPYQTAWYVRADGRLDVEALLDGFLKFWREHGEAMLRSQPYQEVAFQLVVMSFLQRITNGDGSIDREYAIGRGRMDLCIRWPWPGGVQRELLELKVWRDGQPEPLARGLEQLGGYLASLGLDHGALLIFDRRQTAAPLAERSESSVLEHEGRRIRLLRL